MATTLLHTVRATRRFFVIALVIALGALGLYGYMFHAVSASTARISLLEQENAVLVNREASVGDIRKELAAAQESQTILGSYIVDASDIVPFFETIEGYGKLASVTTKFDSVALSADSRSLVVSLSGEGSFTDMYRFLALLEASPYELSIKTAQIQSQASTTAPPVPPKGSAVSEPATDWGIHATVTVMAVNPPKQ